MADTTVPSTTAASAAGVRRHLGQAPDPQTLDPEERMSRSSCARCSSNGSRPASATPMRT